MKQIALAILAVLMIAQSPVFEGKFVVKVDRWDGLYSDELMHPGPTSAADMVNIDIKNESGRSFIQQRQGFIYIERDSSTGCLPGTASQIYGVFVSQLPGDSERVIVGLNVGGIYQKSAIGQWKQLSSNVSHPGCTFTTFKDTILMTGQTRVTKFTDRSGSAGIFQTDDDITPYRRMFLHQDRIYGWSDADSISGKLVWWPEFFITDFSALPDTITGGGYVYVGRDDGDFITNIVTQQSHIIVYKSRSIYKVMISPSTNAPNEIVKLVDNLGAYGHGCVTEYNGDHYFVYEDGVYKFDGVNFEKLSDPINYWFADSLTMSSGRGTILKTAVAENKLYVTLPISSSVPKSAQVGDSRHFVYDLDLKVWYKYDFTGPSLNLNNGSQFLTKYQYSSACVAPLLSEGIYYGQKILFVIDSASNVNRDKICMFPIGWQDRWTDSIDAMWNGAFFPVTDMYQRFNFERLLVFGSTGTRDTIKIDFYSDYSSSIVDSLTIPLTTSSDMTNVRLSSAVQGSLLRYRLRLYGGSPKINRLEFVGNVKGLAE